MYPTLASNSWCSSCLCSWVLGLQVVTFVTVLQRVWKFHVSLVLVNTTVSGVIRNNLSFLFCICSTSFAFNIFYLFMAFKRKSDNVMWAMENPPACTRPQEQGTFWMEVPFVFTALWLCWITVKGLVQVMKSSGLKSPERFGFMCFPSHFHPWITKTWKT